MTRFGGPVWLGFTNNGGCRYGWGLLASPRAAGYTHAAMVKVLTCLFTLMLIALTGCQQPVAEAPNPFEIDATEYGRMYRASIDVLRETGFRVDRQDYRFGRVTTFPKGSPTVAEVWNGDNSTDEQVWQSTLSDIHRRVTVFLDPQDERKTAYDLRIEVLMERRQRPTRRLTGTASRNVFSNLAAVPAHLKERGIEANYWQPMGRDPQMEQKLLHAIVKRSLELPESPEPQLSSVGHP